jgi:hypothetical protein
VSWQLSLINEKCWILIKKRCHLEKKLNWLYFLLPSSLLWPIYFKSNKWLSWSITILMANQSIMKRRFKQWSSVIPPIPTKQPTTYYFWNILATVKNLAIKNIINLASSQDDNVFL